MSHLRVLSLYGFLSTAHLEKVGNTLSTLSKLEKITFSAPTSFGIQKVFNMLSQLPALKQIHATREHGSDETVGGLSTGGPGIRFPSLKSIDLIQGSARLVQQLLSTSNLGGLRRLTIIFGRPNDQDIGQLFLEMAGSCPFVESVDLDMSCWGYEDITFQMIKPIVDSLKLREFSIKHKHPLLITPADTIEIAKAWGPTIETLSLNPEPDISYPIPAHVTRISMLGLASLMHLARHCSKLRRLAIYIDAVSSYKEQPLNPPIFSTTLTLIDFGYSRAPDAETIIDFILRLMDPARGTVHIHGADPVFLGIKTDIWKLVHNAVNMREEAGGVVEGEKAIKVGS